MGRRRMTGFVLVFGLVAGMVALGQLPEAQVPPPGLLGLPSVTDPVLAATPDLPPPSPPIEVQPALPPAFDPSPAPSPEPLLPPMLPAGEAKSTRPAAEPPSSPDPLQDVESFMTRSREQAATSIKSLTTEAETLRAKLEKVEAALAKWEAVARALEGDAERRPPQSRRLSPNRPSARSRPDSEEPLPGPSVPHAPEPRLEPTPH